MSVLKLKLFGQMDSSLPSGEPLSLSTRKADVLLAYLALTPGLRHPRERLVNLLWSDRSEEQARNSLRQCLSAIKKSLGETSEPILEIERSTITLNSASIEVDALEFDQLARASDFDSLSRAATLYQGEFLEGITIRDAVCQDWLDNERGRFKRQLVEVLARLSQALIDSKDLDRAIETTERLVEQDPLIEEGWRLLMRAYHEKGNRNHALKAYQRCHDILSLELGVEPEAATSELREDIAGGKRPVSRPAPISTPVTSDANDNSEHSIAVLPFDNLSGDPEQEYFSDGITDSIILNLSLFPRLHVKSRNSSFAFKQQIKSLGEISRELEVNYLIEGSIRKSDQRIRITVQLIEAESGNQVWGKRYDSDLADLFTLEEDLSRTIAATVTGQIDSELQRIAIAKNAAHQESYDLLLSGRYHVLRFNGPDTVVGIDKLNQCLAQDPNNVQAHALLYYGHCMNWLERWVEDLEASFEIASEHARKALSLGPEDGFVQTAFGEYLIFCREFEKSMLHLDKALMINPNDADALATKSLCLVAQGESELALEVAKIGCRLDPYHPWCDWQLAEAQFFTGRYEDALHTIAVSKNAPGFIRIFNVAASIKLGKMEQARQALKEFVRTARQNMFTVPKSRDEWIAYTANNSPYQDRHLNVELIDYLVQAGLDEELAKTSPIDSPDQQPSLVVLPFENLSSDPEQEYFSNGITESVIQNLSSCSGLNVKSRHTSFAFKDSPLSIDEIARELEVQYIIDGSVRKRGDQVRIAAQLADTSSGNQIWGKRYDAELDRIFELEEELSQTIASTINGRIGKQVKLSIYQKPAINLKSYDYLMRGWYHAEKLNPADTTIAIEQFQKCIEADPQNADAHTMLTAEYHVQLLENWTGDRIETLKLAHRHIEKALELEPDNALAHSFMAEHCHYKRNFEQAMFHAEKTVELNPTLPDGYSMKAIILASMRQYEEAVILAERSIQLDPLHPYIGWAAGEVFRSAGDFERSIKAFRSVPHTSPSMIAQISVCLVDLGKLDQARVEMKLYLDMASQHMPNIPASIEQWRQLWREISLLKFETDFENLFDSLLKAGLCDHINDDSDDIPSIAVLPFENMSGDPEQEYFSDGITASIIMGLGLFTGITVKSQQTSFAFRDSSKPSEEIAVELNVDYLIEGSVRRIGSKLRLNVQLVESDSGNQIWGKQYNSEQEDILDLEQEMSSTIAATISGRIGHKIQQSAVRKPAKNLRSYDLLLRGLYHYGKFTAGDMLAAKELIQKCIDIDPENAEAHMHLGMIHLIERLENWSTDRLHSRKQSTYHCEKALELEPDNALVQAYMAEHLLSMREYERAEFHADKAIELNPNASEGYTEKAAVMGYTRRYKEALTLADHCLQLDPHSVGAGWCAGEVYRASGQYESAIKTFRSIPNPPSSIHAQIAASLAGLGRVDQARIEMKLYLNLANEQMPCYPGSREDWHLFWSEYIHFQYSEDFEIFFDQLLIAGLCDEPLELSDDIPSIAVLPFENMSGDPEQEYFSDGITNDIVTTLSCIRRLRVVARHSTLAYKEHKPTIAKIAEEQGVRYILDGSVRKSGKRIRVNVQLIDSSIGENCWAENYDRDLKDIFALQDEITKNIAVEMQVQLLSGDSAREVSAGTRSIKAWELVSMAWDLQDSYIEDNMLKARRQVDKALKLDPEYSAAWVVLGWTHWQAANVGFSESIDDSIREARNAADKALLIDPENAEALVLKGSCHITSNEPGLAVETCRKAVEISPGNAEVQALTAYALVYAGEYDIALPHHEASLRLCPICPNWFQLVGGTIYQRTGDLDKAIAAFRKGVETEPESPLCRYYLIDALMDAGREKEARACADEIRALDSRFRISGMLQSHSHNKDIREGFRANLEKVGFEGYCV